MLPRIPEACWLQAVVNGPLTKVAGHTAGLRGMDGAGFHGDHLLPFFPSPFGEKAQMLLTYSLRHCEKMV